MELNKLLWIFIPSIGENCVVWCFCLLLFVICSAISAKFMNWEAAWAYFHNIQTLLCIYTCLQYASLFFPSMVILHFHTVGCSVQPPNTAHSDCHRQWGTRDTVKWRFCKTLICFSLFVVYDNLLETWK